MAGHFAGTRSPQCLVAHSGSRRGEDIRRDRELWLYLLFGALHNFFRKEQLGPPRLDACTGPGVPEEKTLLRGNRALGKLIHSELPAAQGCAAICNRDKRLETKGSENRVFRFPSLINPRGADSIASPDGVKRRDARSQSLGKGFSEFP